MDTEKTYGPKLVCQSVGISQRQLVYWSMIGVIKPTKQMHGSKIFNRYTESDIETLRKVKKLTEEGFFVSKAAEKVHQEAVEFASGSNPSDRGQDAVHFNRNTPSGLSSSLYLEVRLNEEINRVQQSYQPLSCMVIQIHFPSHFKFSQEKSRILFELSHQLVSHKAPSDVISYKKEGIFLWLLPNRTLDEACLFSKEIKRLIEEPLWDAHKERFGLKAAFGFGCYSYKKDANILAEAERSLNTQMHSSYLAGESGRATPPSLLRRKGG